MAISLDDLIEKCVSCGGSGEKSPPPASAGGGGFGQKVSEVWISNTCEPCFGTGRVKLTEGGEALLKFIQIMKKRSQV